LTYHQRRIMEQYYDYDLSMAEIAEEEDISRSAVSEIIKLSTDKLLEYEQGMKLLETEKALIELLEALEGASNQERDKIVKRIKDIITHGI
jgi:predicted DNA-binding protein YlxM (UPF0122 family)